MKTHPELEKLGLCFSDERCAVLAETDVGLRAEACADV